MYAASEHDGLRQSGGRTRHARLPAAVSLCCLVFLAGLSNAKPIDVEQFSKDLTAGPVHVFVATIDLKDPTLKIVANEPMNAADRKNAKAEAKLMRTDEWAIAHKATLAINANYFGLLEKAKDAPAASHGYVPGLEADVIGVCVSDGVVISQPRIVDGVGDPAVLIRKDGTATVKRATTSDLEGVTFAVAGVGVSDSKQDAYPGSLLVQAGKNYGSTARVAPDARHPRTALGVTADGSHLIVMVVDGRAPGYSVGVTLAELADLLIEHGAVDAVNLDGGGSTAFVYRPHSRRKAPSGGTEKEVSNRPSDGGFRPVANHLGFVVVGAEDQSVQLPASGASPKVEDPNPNSVK